jgi:hypothetical protein
MLKRKDSYKDGPTSKKSGKGKNDEQKSSKDLQKSAIKEAENI